MAIRRFAFPPFRLFALRRGQAFVELACGLFALALVVSALCGFAHYVVKALEIQNKLRVGGRKGASVDVSGSMSKYVFGAETLKISEKLQMPATSVAR